MGHAEDSAIIYGPGVGSKRLDTADSPRSTRLQLPVQRLSILSNVGMCRPKLSSALHSFDPVL